MQLWLMALLFTISAHAKIQSELSGNLETQARRSWNNSEAKEDLLQDWETENFYLIYGNLNGKINFDHSHFETNLFVRYSQSNLYNPRPNALGNDDPYLATRFYTFPNKLVARDIFKLQYEQQNGNHLTEAVLNKFYYEWDYYEHRFMIGRMYINYGIGEIFNPINPFNQPTALTSISQVAQGNDGLSFTFFISDDHTIQFLLLGDKKLDNYNGDIDRTIWANGDYQHNEKLQFNYVLGEDQKRYKIGGQASYHLEEALIFTQIFYQTEYVNNDPSDHLWDILLGLDQQLTNLWHIRFESGYQKMDQNISLYNFSERFLPTEYFAALSNIYEVHPLIKINLTIVNDLKSSFTYTITKATYNFGDDMEAEIFGYIPAAKGKSAANVTQKLVTTDVGFAIRAFF